MFPPALSLYTPEKNAPQLLSDDVHVPTKDEYNTFLNEYCSAVGKILADSLPPIVDRGPGIRMYDERDLMLSLDQLVTIRRMHDTDFARKAVRTPTFDSDPVPNNTSTVAEKQDLQARLTLIKKIGETLKLQQDLGPSSGLGRKVRWTTNEPTGNAANAAAAAETRAAKVC